MELFAEIAASEEPCASVIARALGACSAASATEAAATEAVSACSVRASAIVDVATENRGHRM
jgi:hypothetical protein